MEKLVVMVEEICKSHAEPDRQASFHRLSIALRPINLRPETKERFVRQALELGVVGVAVRAIVSGSVGLFAAAANFLSDLSFSSDVAARAVFCDFDRIMARFQHFFGSQEPWKEVISLQAALGLCLNIAAMFPSVHATLVRLVRPVYVWIIESPAAPDTLRGTMITLFANLSTTASPELREMGVAEALLRLVLERGVSGAGSSVAESVIIFICGGKQCAHVDKLVAADVIGSYCVPLMEATLDGRPFRGLYPLLVYSAKVFLILAQIPEYARALAAHEQVTSVLIRASRKDAGRLQVSSDDEGRRMALEALWSLARLRLWPKSCVHAAELDNFLHRELQLLLEDGDAGIRGAAAGLWSRVDDSHVAGLLLAGRCAEAQGLLAPGLWRAMVLPFLFPFFADT